MSLTIAYVLISCLFVWAAALTYLFYSQHLFFKNFTKGITKKDLKTSLKNVALSLSNIGTEIHSIHDLIEKLQKNSQLHIQKIGFIRYNPYADTGGDQSFCLCLLSRHNDGILISSLHSREHTRIYAKPIRRGNAVGYQLSKEETQTLEQAISS